MFYFDFKSLDASLFFVCRVNLDAKDKLECLVLRE